MGIASVSRQAAAELQGLGLVPAGTRRAVRCAEETTPLLFDAAQNAARVCHFVASNASMASTVNATNDSSSLSSASNATNSSFDRVSSPPRLRREQWESSCRIARQVLAPCALCVSSEAVI